MNSSQYMKLLRFPACICLKGLASETKLGTYALFSEIFRASAKNNDRVVIWKNHWLRYFIG